MRRFALALVLVSAALGPMLPARVAGAATGRMYILPVGLVPQSDLNAISGALTAFFSVDVRQLAPVPLPRSAYYPPRQRYRADKLLDYVEGMDLPRDGRAVLAVTAAPISITKGKIYDWGIMGYVAIGGKICAYSTYYAKRFTKSSAHARARVGKVAVHEFAHNLGLPHCSVRGCLMEDAQGTPAMFDRVYDFCPRCRAALIRRGWPAPASQVIPWPRPAPNAGPSDAYLKKLRKRWE